MASITNPPSLLNSTPIVPQPSAPIFELPHEVITTRILALLPASEVATASLVCREWCRKFEYDYTFRSIFSLQFPSIDENTIKNFKDFYHFYTNLTRGVYASHTFHGHNEMVYSLAVIGQTLFSGSGDCTIKAWDIKTGKCIATFEGHENSVYSLAVIGQTLFSGSADNTIKAWNIKTGECIATFHGHRYGVDALASAGQTLFSGSDDDTIKAWDIKTGECIATFQGHKATVFCLAVAGETLFSGSQDNTIKAWNIKTGECIATFEGHKRSVFCLAVVGETLFSSSADCTIKAWDIKTGECIATFHGHEEDVSSLAIVGTTLFSVSEDNTIKAWNIKTGECIATFHSQEELGFPLAVVGKTLFSGLGEGTIKARDFMADHSEIFKEIAQLLEEGTPEATEIALERFSKMPMRARKTICAILHANLDKAEMRRNVVAFATTVLDEIKKRTANPEAVFYDKCRYPWATPVQKAQAIRDYLKQKALPSGTGFSANGKRTYDTAFRQATMPPTST